MNLTPAVIVAAVLLGLAGPARPATIVISDTSAAVCARAASQGLADEASAYQDYEEALVLEPGWDLPKQELLRFTVTRK